MLLRFSRCSSLLSEIQHEMGHNLGLMHSGEGNDEYGDQSGEFAVYLEMESCSGQRSPLTLHLYYAFATL